MTKTSTWSILQKFPLCQLWVPQGCHTNSLLSLSISSFHSSDPLSLQSVDRGWHPAVPPCRRWAVSEKSPGKLWLCKSAPPCWEGTPMCAQGCCHTSSPEAWGRSLLSQINSGVIAELGIFHFTYFYFSNSLGTKGLLEPPECPSSLSPQRQTPPIIDIFNKQSLSHEAVGVKHLATRQP